MTVLFCYLVCFFAWSAICCGCGAGFAACELARGAETEEAAYRRGLAAGRVEAAFGDALAGRSRNVGGAPRARA